MTTSDRMKLLRKAVKERGQSQVARELEYSPAVVHHVVNGTYTGRTDRFLEQVAEVYGTDTIDCPVLGEVTLKRCSQERKTPFSAASPLRVRIHRACQECGRR